jgi:hypothetical protein
MRQLLLLLLCFLSLSTSASLSLANGRAPGTSDVRAHSGSEDIAAGTTFGLTISNDGGASWKWVCEDAAGYSGTYDPDYEWSSNGALFLPSFTGLRVSRDYCNFDLVAGLPDADGDPKTGRYINTIAFGPDGALYAAAIDDSGSKVYRSTDDGVTFPQSSQANPPFMNYDMWLSVEVAASDAARVYLAGLRNKPGVPREFLLYRSNDAAANFTSMSTTGITGLSPVGNQNVEIAGISHTNPDILYVRVTDDGNVVGSDAIYRSADGGASWTKVLAKADSLRAFVVRRNGEIIAGTPTMGAFKSTDGINFTPLAGAPHLNCLSERADGMLFGCTQNYGTNGDNAGIMKSADGVTWASVLRYQDIAAPMSCAPGTTQKDSCEVEEWCGIREQLSISSTVIDCPAVMPPDGVPDGGMMPDPSSGGGCCETGAQPPSLLLCGLTALLLAWRKRRPASRQ